MAAPNLQYIFPPKLSGVKVSFSLLRMFHFQDHPLYIDLSNNQLFTLPPGAFQSPSTISVEVTGNPMQCSSICWVKQTQVRFYVNCADYFYWEDWDGLDSNGQCVTSAVPTCPLPSTIPTPVQCPDSCLNPYYYACYQGLTNIPNDIPDTATEVNLCHNNLTAFPSQELSLPLLKDLFMDHNQISFVDLKALFGMQSLLRLSLNNNQIKNLPTGVFFRFDKPRTD